ncbi:MAG: MlaE family lipid ABC transporter permease subunit [Magnetospirillum sp.]|jgi:phospholipid/cholesterol/gamma-HCH transport system permease protein|nr:MlaE family lipid ABC transporter permease subunit [Magnetospirillum sp.]
MATTTQLPNAQAVWAKTQFDGSATRVALGGRWTLANASMLETAMQSLDTKGAELLHIDLAAVDAIDTCGAWILHRQLRRWQGSGAQIELVSTSDAQAALLERMGVADEERVPLLRKSDSAFTELAIRAGKAATEVAREAKALIAFVGSATVCALRALRSPGRVRFVSTVHHIERIGIDAVPILGLLAFLIGVVLAFQGADQLRAYGAEVFTINLLGVSILREIGVLITAIMVAGRTGSAFAAEIGTMKVNQEVDAMRTIGLDPMETLVLPRLLALAITLPLLVFFANTMALVGGAVMVMLGLDLSFEQFVEQLSNAVQLNTLAVGLIKAPVFAVLIGIVSCYEGLKVSGSAESVGRHTTQSVVKSIFLVIVFDAAFSIFFSRIGL